MFEIHCKTHFSNVLSKSKFYDYIVNLIVIYFYYGEHDEGRNSGPLYQRVSMHLRQEKQGSQRLHSAWSWMLKS